LPSAFDAQQKERIMNAPSSSDERGSGRRFIVAVVVATTAAAVTAGVAFNERRSASERPLSPAAEPLGRAGEAAAVVMRRAPLAGSAARSTADPPDAAGAHWDPSLPPAAEVLEHAPGAADERVPKF
jgi:hypothetical protein